MVQQHTPELVETLKTVAAKVQRFQGRGIGEQNTKASLIEPVLEALGWDIREFDEVQREFRPTSKDSPVDYALKIQRRPRLFVEAKGLDENLADRKWIAQVLGYATVAGVEWCLLTDGDEYRFYNATVPLDAEEKLFTRFRLSEASPVEAAKMLAMVSRENMQENLLDMMWTAHFVDRQVRTGLLGLFKAPQSRFVRLIRDLVPKLTPSEILESLQRLEIRIDAPSNLDSLPTGAVAQPPVARTPAVKHKSTRQKSTARTDLQVSLRDLIQAGLLVAPLRLFRHYKKQDVEARLLVDGRVEFAGEIYATASGAAAHARGSITGTPMATNGWSFWQFASPQGRTQTLEDVREQYVQSRESSANST
jgi:hypothetical protein